MTSSCRRLGLAFSPRFLGAHLQFRSPAPVGDVGEGLVQLFLDQVLILKAHHQGQAEDADLCQLHQQIVESDYPQARPRCAALWTACILLAFHQTDQRLILDYSSS